MRHTSLLTFNIYPLTFNATKREYSTDDTCLVNTMIIKIPESHCKINHSAYIYGAWDGEWILDSKYNSNNRGLKTRIKGETVVFKGLYRKLLWTSWPPASTLSEPGSFFIFICCVVVAHLLIISDSLSPHGLQPAQASLPFTVSQSLLKLVSIESVYGLKVKEWEWRMRDKITHRYLR